MNIVGVSAGYHDSSAALVVGGKVVAACAEERFSRVRHDASFPTSAIDACLSSADLASDEVDLVAYYEEPELKFSRVLASIGANFPGSAGTFATAMHGWLREKLWIREHLAKHFGVSPDRVRAFPHHTSHAAQAFFPSPFESAAVITLDAVGEWTCSAIAMGDRRENQRPISTVHRCDYPNSLGLFYSAFTLFLGFQPNSDECSTMALATFGTPRYVDRVQRILTLTDDGGHRVDTSYLNLLRAGAPFTRKFEKLFGPARRAGTPLPFDIYTPGAAIDGASQYYADVAASVQSVLEEAVLRFARLARQLTNSPRLCFSGGVALNCVANERLLSSGLFEDVYIPSDPGDGGAALGVALYAAATHAQPCSDPGSGPYLGKPHGEWQAGEVLRQLKERGPTEGLPAFHWCAISGEDERCERIANALASGLLCGVHRHRSEFGPRALGNRSILAAANNVELAQRLSQRVKHRAPFRPYALVVTDEYATEAFEMGSQIPRCARLMQTVVKARTAHRDRVRGGLHVDDTTRIQVCSKTDNPFLHELLERYGAQSGTEALINTSLNLRGEPIVESPLDSLSMFFRSELDILMIDDIVLEKEQHRAA